MPSLTIPESGLSLGSRSSSAKSDVPYPDIFTLSLGDSVIEDMIKCVRNRKPIQLSLGNDPKIVYGSDSQDFTTIPDPFPCDYFQTTFPQNPSSAPTLSPTHIMSQSSSSLWGMSKRRFVPSIRVVKNGVTISQTGPASVKPAQKKSAPKDASTPEKSPTEGVDAALAALKSSLASEDARKKENITKHVKDTSTLPPAVQQRGPAKSMKEGNKARFLSQSDSRSLSGKAARSMPTSPALTGVSSPAMGPTSVPLSQQQAERTKAIRRPIIHQLALGPATDAHVGKYKRGDSTEQEFRLALEKVGQLENGQWKLKPKSFRDLDIFSYKSYTPEERQIAIDNAIHVYDKIRLATSEPDWDRLLPFSERGTGKCLSKLQAKIAVGAMRPSKGPRIKVQGAEDSGRDTPAAGEEDIDDLFGDKLPATQLKSESMVRSHSNPPATKPKRTSEKEQQAKRLLAKTKITKSTSKASDKKSAAKESSKIKSSEFVHESDEEDDYLLPAPKATPTSTTTSKTNGTQKPTNMMKQSTKTSSHDALSKKPLKVNGTSKPKVNNTSPPKSSPLASSPPTNASDFEDSCSSSSTRISRDREEQVFAGGGRLKRKATDSSSDIPISKRHQKSSSSTTSSSVGSSHSIVNGDRQDPFYYEVIKKDISATKKFNIYYAKYANLYRELAESQDKDRDVEKMAQLMDMQDRLAQMKADILPAANT